ncbi:MAG: CapA family protein [Promethearchaeota archaeon]
MLSDKIFTNYVSSPYSFKETISWFKRFIVGPDMKNEGNVNYLPRSYSLNNITPKYTISFIGDIMDMSSRDLIIDGSIKNFVRGSDFLIGNFEATLTAEKTAFMKKRHKPQIMDALETLFRSKKTYLSTANNHGGDFGQPFFIYSVSQLKERGFNVFGNKETPFQDLTDDLRVIGSTQWSNRPCDYLIKFEHSEQFLKEDSFNLLFPHWGYEMELYPRTTTINHGRTLLNEFDALIGHHSHCPQPVSFFSVDNVNKLIAYSLGNFCIGIENKMHSYGIVMKVEIGKNWEDKWLIGKVDWAFIGSRFLNKQEFTVEIVENYDPN